MSEPEGLEATIRQRLSGGETKLLLRLGDLHASRKPSKHSGGYRDYEVVSESLSDQEIWLSKDGLILHGLTTERSLTKYWNDGRRQAVTLTDLTGVGLLIYLNIKHERGQVGLGELSIMHNLVFDHDISIKSIDLELLIRFVHQYESASVINNENSAVYDSIKLLDAKRVLEFSMQLRKAVEKSNQNLSNYERSNLYELLDKIEKESRKEYPNIKYLILLYKIIKEGFMLFAAVATIASAALTYFSQAK